MVFPSHRSFTPLAAAAAAAALSLLLAKYALASVNDVASASDTAVAVSLALAALVILRSVVAYVPQAMSLVLPGPPPLPLMGNALSLVSQGSLQESIRHISNTYGRCVDLLLGGERIVMVNDPDFCKAAMKSTDRGLVEPNYKTDWKQRFLSVEIWGYGDIDLFTRSNEVGGWKHRRKMLQPAFDQRHVRAAVPTITAAASRLLKRLDALADAGEKFDVLPVLQNFALSAIFATSFGTDINNLPDGSDGRWIVEAMNLQCKLYSGYEFDPFLWVRTRLLPPLGLNRMELQRRDECRRLRKFMADLLEQEKQRQAKERSDGPKTSSLMSIMISSSQSEKDSGGGGLDDGAILDEMGSFVFAGYDTTSVTLSVLLNHLAKHPGAQRRVHAEIDEALAAAKKLAGTGEAGGSGGGGGGDGSTDLIEGARAAHPLKFLSACIRESQRLQPIAPIVSRRLERPTELPAVKGSAATLVPRGTKVLIPIFMLHRNETFYPHPEEYQPERWLPEESNNGGVEEGPLLKPAPGGTFYAFGGGPKMCVGFQLAERELKIAALSILSRFRVVSGGELKIKDEFVTGPEAVWISLSKR